MTSLRVARRIALFLTWEIYDGPDRSVASTSLTKIQEDKDKTGEENRGTLEMEEIFGVCSGGV
jgi:hypothetical protein